MPVSGYWCVLELNWGGSSGWGGRSVPEQGLGVWKPGGGVGMEARPPLAASLLPLESDPAPMLPCRTWERTLGGCDVGVRVPITPKGRPRGVRGRVLLHPTLSLGGPGHAAAVPTLGLRVSATHSRPELPNVEALPGEPA